MITIHARNLRYRLVFVQSSGAHLDLTHAVSELTLEHQAGELAQRLSWKMVNCKFGSGYLSDQVKLCTLAMLYADWGAGLKEIFRGPVWDWDAVSTTTKEFSGDAYDNLIYLQKSKDNLYFSAGMGTDKVLRSICAKWNVPLVYSYGAASHGALTYKAQAISDAIVGTLDDAKKKLGYGYVVRSSGGIMYVLRKGTNTDIPAFGNLNVTSSEHKITLDNLVTKVLVVQSNGDNKQDTVAATVIGSTQYGVLQDVITVDSSSGTTAKAQGQAVLDEYGKPTEDIELDSAVDVPFLHKGDRISVGAGTLAGSFWVTGVTHNCIEGSMQATLERAA